MEKPPALLKLPPYTNSCILHSYSFYFTWKIYEVKMWKWWFLSLQRIQVMLQWADVKIILETCFKSDCSKLQLQMYSMQEISHQVGNYKTGWCNTSVAKLKMGVLKMLQWFSTELQRTKILWLKLVFTMWEVGWSLLFQTTKHILLHTKAKEWKYYFGREKKNP